MSLEYFDYDVPETPSYEDLIQDIIKTLKWTNEKINFMAFHSAQDLIHLPSGMFIDDIEDIK